MTKNFDLSDYEDLAAIVDAKVSPQVTSHNDWASDHWRLDGAVPGMEESQFTVHFDIAASRRTIDELKWLTALLFLGRYGQRTYKHSTASVFSAGMRHLARFMKQNDHRSFASLDRQAFQEYRDSILVTLVDPAEQASIESDQTDEELDDLALTDGIEPMPFIPGDIDADGGIAVAYNRLRIWKLLYDNRAIMAEAGIKPIKFNPFTKESATVMARGLATKAADEIPALPDEIALPVLAGAARLLGRPADDVIELQRRYLEKMQRMGRQPPTAERVLLRRTIEDFEFGRIKGEDRPWHDRIKLGDDEAGGGGALAELIDTIRAACLITIMGFTGVRISEAVSPEVEPRVIINDVLPSCVEVEPSKSGLSDHFMLKGLLSKAQERPTPEKWLMGARPKLTGAEPPALRAVCVLELLYAPWRRFASDPLAQRRLFTGFLARGLPRDPDTVGTATSHRLRLDMKAFVGDPRYVELSGLAAAARSKPELVPYLATETAKVGACIRPHQWRKTFMRYAMRTDPRMAPAVSQHFKHYTVALTERDYGPKDAKFLQQADSTRARATGVALRRILEGKSRPIARLEKAIALAKDQWASLVPDGAAMDDDGFTALAINEDLRIWDAEHGRCLVALQPDEARCHERAGTAGWRHARPNRLTRTPSLCLGCANFSVHDGSVGYWRRRYVENQRAFIAAGGELGFEIIRRQAETAAKFLRALGEKVPDITDKGEAA